MPVESGWELRRSGFLPRHYMLRSQDLLRRLVSRPACSWPMMVNSMIGVQKIGLLVVPEVLLGLLDRFDIINMLPPADATVLLTTSEAESAPLPESPTAFAGYAWFIISALAGVKGVADKIGEKRVDQAAALLECSIAPPEWPPSGVDTAAGEWEGGGGGGQGTAAYGGKGCWLGGWRHRARYRGLRTGQRALLRRW